MIQMSSLAIDTRKQGKKPVLPLGPARPDILELAQQSLLQMQQNIYCDEQFTITVLNSESTETRAFYAARLQSENVDLVVKINFTGENNIKFQREISTQQKLHTYFKDFAGMDVPEVVFAPKDCSFFVMKYVAGAGIFEALRNHIFVEDEDAIFRRAGQWLAKIHALRVTQIVALDTENTLRSMEARIRGPEALINGIYEAEEFGVYHQKFRDAAQDFEGRDNPIVLGHGDFHGQNLVFSENSVTGLDFYNVRRLSAGADIARFLVHADLAQYEDPASIGPLGLVQSHVDAFFEGYGMALTPEHVFNHFIRLRLLETWSRIPERNRNDHVSQSGRDMVVSRTKLAFLA